MSASSGPTGMGEHEVATVFADIERVLLSREQIADRIEAMGSEIQRDLDTLGDDAQILLLPILTGSIIFVADLMRHLSSKLSIDVVTVSSYPGDSTSSKGAQIVGALPQDVTGMHVLIVDDILDSGGTIRLIRDEIHRRGPASVQSCVLLRKRLPSAMETPCEYVGFDIDDEFVVGFGLDYDNYYRNLPEIGVLKKEAM